MVCFRLLSLCSTVRFAQINYNTPTITTSSTNSALAGVPTIHDLVSLLQCLLRFREFSNSIGYI